MAAAPSRKPAMPPDSSVMRLRTDEQAPVDCRSLEEADPVEPQLLVGDDPRTELGCREHRLELVDRDRAVAVDPLERPRHPLHDHLVDERAQVAVGEPDVTAHAVVVRPIERAAHPARTLLQSCRVSACRPMLADATASQRSAPSSSGRGPVRRMPARSVPRPTAASAIVINPTATSASTRRASAPTTPTVSRTEASTKRTRNGGTSLVGRPRARETESASAIGMISVVRVSFTTTACAPAAWPNA